MRVTDDVEPDPRVDDAAPHPPTTRRFVQWAVYASPIAVFLGAGWAHRWVAEDGFIYLRVVQQIRAGNGPVFNAGERVEAFTGPLWVAILSIADLVAPFRLEWIAVVLGLTCGAAGIAFATAGARRLWDAQGDDALFLPLGALVFVAVLPVWVFATSGLETGLSFAWLGGCLWILADWARSPDRALTIPRAVVLGLGWLVRPELALFSAAFLVLVVVFEQSEHPGRTRARTALAMIALPLAYQLFRMGYYGNLVPNTAIAKEGSSSNFERGWRYFSDFVDPYWLWIPALALLAGGYLPLGAVLARAGRRRALWVTIAFGICAALQAGYMITVGGDHTHARLLLPAFFAMCAPVAFVPATRRQLAGLVLVPWALAAAVSLRPPQYNTDNFIANGTVIPRTFGTVTIDDYGWGGDGQFRRWYTGPAYYYEAGLLRYPSADIPLRDDVELPVGAFWGVGMTSYALGPDFRVIDLLGLGDSFTAHLESAPSSVPGMERFAGHEKPLPAPWLAARLTPVGSRPDPKDFPNFANPLIPPTTGAAFQEQVAWARAALECGDIEDIVRATDAPLSVGRFAHNLVHAFGTTRARIAPDPEEAYHRACGPGTPPEVQELRGD